METDNLYSKVYSLSNLVLAWKKARKHKTKKDYVINFERDLYPNLIKLHYELKNQTYNPRPLKTFILRDPKTRKISKADFRDRVVHHALVRIIEPILEKMFIYDSCANRIGKGNLFALKRFDLFKRKITRIKNRPLIGTIIKPKIGLAPKDHANVAYEAWFGGCDVVKDDENLVSQNFNKFESRLKETLRLKERALNPYIAMFLIPLIKKEKIKFHYGRKWRIERMAKSSIKLPINENNKPDWEFMESYIKGLSYSKEL
jgi:hypothetical protein